MSPKFVDVFHLLLTEGKAVPVNGPKLSVVSCDCETLRLAYFLDGWFRDNGGTFSLTY